MLKGNGVAYQDNQPENDIYTINRCAVSFLYLTPKGELDSKIVEIHDFSFTKLGIEGKFIFAKLVEVV
jgi:hypothetical protein